MTDEQLVKIWDGVLIDIDGGDSLSVGPTFTAAVRHPEFPDVIGEFSTIQAAKLAAVENWIGPVNSLRMVSILDERQATSAS